MPNLLKNEKSPYLLQHMDNPVNWYPWCEEAFEKARQEDKPVFLSIGYSTCHWCHVMAHESFEDNEVADILNRDFISIKVDREERPDIDSVYMSVCISMMGSGGWPLTVFLTPDKKPFYAATYLPKHSNAFQHGLMDLLNSISYMWSTEREKILSSAVQELRQTQVSGTVKPHYALAHRAFEKFCRRFDNKWGGFGRAPKFPTPHNLLFLMRYGQAENKEEALKMTETTLDAMSRGGIFDHIGGGFSRYSTDGKWLVPHFEKMLYDNALLILAYLDAYQLTKKEEYADIVRRTAEYILREMASIKGGFFSSQDADSDGIEGKYYVFTPEEIKSVLGDADGAEFCRLYDITQQGNFEGKSIPNRIGQTEKSWSHNDERLQKLYKYRLQRTRLHKDDKILLSWNAWMITAMARAGLILSDERYLSTAIKAKKFIREQMTDERNRLFLRYRDGETANAGQLDDYAVYALSLLELYRITFDTEYLSEAILRAEQMLEQFNDKHGGGFFMTAEDAEKLIVRPKETYDGAIPSGNSVAAVVLQKLAYLTGTPKWQDAANRQLSFISEIMGDEPSGSSFGLLAVLDTLYPHKELVCVSGDKIPDELCEYIKNSPSYGLEIILKTRENEQLLAECAPFTADYPIPSEGVMYYLCEKGACKTPVKDFKLLDLD